MNKNIPSCPFPVGELPEPVRSFVSAGSKALGTPTAHLGTAILPALASAIGNTAVIRLKHGWTEPAVLWGVIVGESGDRKSPVLDLALGAIRKRQSAAIVAFEKEWDEYQIDQQRHDADLKDWQRKGRSKGEPAPEPPIEPICERQYCSDITTEALAARLEKNPRGLLVARDELGGWLGSFDRYSGGKGDAAHWLTMHGARDLLVDRKGAGQKPIFVPRAAVSIVGGIQPAILRRALGREHFENGLAARLLLAMPPAQVKEWTEATIDSDLEAAMNRVFDSLYALQPSIAQDGRPKPMELGLAKNGKQVWIRFYNQQATAQADASGDFAAMLSKIEGAAARLALVVHLVRFAAGDTTLKEIDQIDAQSVISGTSLARWYAYEAQRVYGTMAESEEDSELRTVSEWIRRRGGSATARQLRQGMRQFRNDAEAAEAALTELVRRHYGEWEDVSPDASGGRPSRIFRLSTSSTVYETPSIPEKNVGSVDVDTVNQPLDVDPNNLLMETAAGEEVEAW